MTRYIAATLLVVTLLFSGACTNMTKTQQGALTGGVIGAGAGAGIAAIAGAPYWGVGAAVGGALGAVAGGLYGHEQEKKPKKTKSNY